MQFVLVSSAQPSPRLSPAHPETLILSQPLELHADRRVGSNPPLKLKQQPPEAGEAQLHHVKSSQPCYEAHLQPRALSPEAPVLLHINCFLHDVSRGMCFVPDYI